KLSRENSWPPFCSSSSARWAAMASSYMAATLDGSRSLTLSAVTRTCESAEISSSLVAITQTLRRSGSESDRNGAGGAVPVDGERHLVAGLVGLDGGDERVGTGHCRSVDLGDDVTLLQAGGVGGRARADVDHNRTLICRLCRHAEEGGARRGRRGRLTGPDVGDERLDAVDADGEPDVLRRGTAVAGVLDHGRVHADHLAAAVHQRAARVAGIDGGVGLD